MSDCLLSHNATDAHLETIVQEAAARIEATGDADGYSVAEQLNMLHELQSFPLGRFLLANKGLNGYWTHYLLTYPWWKQEKNTLPPMEHFFLEKIPTVLAVQERFQIYLKEAQQHVRNDACFASIPSGALGELLYLDFTDIKRMHLVGIDYDPNTLEQAQAMAQDKQLSHWVTLEQADAWKLTHKNTFDLISSNGLNIYEPSDERVIELYTVFYDALKPNGTLLTSFITPPPYLTDTCEWNQDAINPADLLKQHVIYRIIGGKWQCFRSTDTTRQQLQAAGFKDIRFIPDKGGMYPTVIAKKS